MADIQKVSDPLRPETGAMQFPNDWPGVFIRGDEALGILALIKISEGLDIAANEYSFRGLLRRVENILKQCAVTDKAF